MNCPICLSPKTNNTLYNAQASLRRIDCTRCGSFGISKETAEDAANLAPNYRWRISAWICEYAPRIVSWEEIERAQTVAVPGLMHRAVRMLAALNKWYPRGVEFDQNPELLEKLGGIGWCVGADDARYMLQQVLGAELNYVEIFGSFGRFRITPKGLLYLEGRRTSASTVGFCAMWFSDEVKPLWAEVIEPAIRATGYEPLRIDSKQHNGKIDDEIMASIRGAKFVVADFTGNRGGVYYEAGFAHGLDLPVIFMCREGDDLHFDIRQYNCIFWKLDNLDDARERLKNRILATLGKGPLQIQ